MTIGSSSGIMAWSDVPSLTSADVRVNVNDGKVDVMYFPRIKLCQCQVRQKFDNETLTKPVCHVFQDFMSELKTELSKKV